MIVFKREPAVERTIEFVAKFATSLCLDNKPEKTEDKNEEEEQEEEDEEMHPFLLKIFSFLLKVSLFIYAKYNKPIFIMLLCKINPHLYSSRKSLKTWKK